MENKNPFLPLLNQVVDMMSSIQSNKRSLKKEVPKDLQEQLEHFQKELARAKVAAEDFLKAFGKNFNTLRIEAMSSSNVPASDKKSFERAIQVVRDAKILKSEMEKIKKKSKTEVKNKKSDQEQQIKERTKRLKPLTGKKNWHSL